MFTPARLFLPLFLSASALFATEFSTVAPEKAGFDPARLQRVDTVIEHAIADHRLAGAVLYLAKDGHIVRLTPYGHFDIEAGKPMKEDTLFRIASMSKAVTTVAVMMLYEEGHFLLNEPISKYIPAFANPVVALKSEGGAKDQKPATEKAKREITIRDLLTHTAGLSYGDGPAEYFYKEAKINGWYLADRNETIGEVVDRIAKLPLQGHPGEAFQYGYSTDVLGRLVEVISGMPLDRFFQERIFTPLEMKDTSFFPSQEKGSRLMPVYGFEKGVLQKGETSEKSDYLNGPRKCFSGGAGLISSARDYGRFLQMLANGGELEGKRLLSPLTVELMHKNHTRDLYKWDTKYFGLGFWVNEQGGEYGELMPEGAYGWGSAYYPQYVIDPKNKIVTMLLTQLRPSGDLNLNATFKVLVYQALVK